jgi:hypothetical protein
MLSFVVDNNINLLFISRNVFLKLIKLLHLADIVDKKQARLLDQLLMLLFVLTNFFRNSTRHGRNCGESIDIIGAIF